MGTLIWYETDNSEKPRHAPVLLIPMEIIRKSVQSGYLVRAGEDEPQLNITLLEMLRQDFGIDITGLDTLPTDEHGIDVQKVFTIIRRAIIHKARWDVIEDAYLGLFSFSKFVMWHDLKARNQDLLKNKVVKSLMAGSIQWQPTEACSGANLLDTTYHPKDIICPVSADSSQLMAVTAAGEGRSIVLHGPPGTGKSQTITNIIAHSLAQGKTVLFVAEKMAALSVVQRRLDQIGLAPFCLELHSNKTRKKDVLNQLNGSLESARINNPQNWEQEANRLAKLRGELNDYVQALHRDRSLGHSFFHGLSRLSAVRDVLPVVVFQSKDVNNMNPDTLDRWESLTRQLKIAGESCGHPHRHPWEHSHPTDYLPQMRSQLGELLPLLLEQIQHWQTTVYSVAEILDLKNHTDSYQDLMHIMEITRLFIDNPAIPGTMIAANDWDEVRSAVDRWIDHGLKRDTLREAVFTRYTERVLQLDIAALQERLAGSMQEWFLPRWLGQYQVKKALQKAVKPGVQIDSEELEQELHQLQNLCEEERVLSSASDRARSLLGKLWQDGNANWDAEPESVFEEQIINALEARGHHVHPQVGCSGYRIDIAVIDPEHPGKYLLGIECDGATYHRAKTARDRDKLREAVLRQLGWEIHRVWSTDWWENPEREIERIEQAIEDAKTKSTRHETSPNKPVVEAPARIAQNVVKPVEVEQEIKSNATEYRICELPLVSKIQEEFYLDANNHIIYNQIMQVVNLEGPISHNLLCRRIIQAWGISKIGSRIDTRIRKLCLKFKLVKTKYDTSTYYWPKNCEPMKYTSFRVPGSDKLTRRSIEDIPPEEIQNGCLEVLRNQISLPEEDLIRETARLFGYQRKGPTVEMHIKHGIDQLVKRGRANRDADNSIVIAE